MFRSRDLKVGLFVLVGLLLFGAVVFMVGQERNLFARSVEFKTSFPDVQGLKAGAPVRMGGIDVGQISFVGYDPEDAKDSAVHVRFWVRAQDAERVRIDTRTRIGNKGLLGDKLVELTVGTDDSAEAGATLESDPASDMFGQIGTVAKQAEVVAKQAEVVMGNLERATRPLGDEKLHKDIQASVANVNVILEEVAHGDGYPNKLLTDPEESERISNVLAGLEKTTKEAELAIRDVRGMVNRVQTGPGFAHDLIYGQPQGLPEFAGAAAEVTTTLRAIREGDGIVKDALFGGTGDNATLTRNIVEISTDLRAILADVRAGKGTIGGLLVDPTIYEDVKIVLGNVQRNDVLRALVRYSINKDQDKPDVNVAGPK